MVWVLPHVPTEQMQINLKGQAVLTEKIERSKEFGELSNEPSVSPGGSQEDFEFCSFGLVSRFRLLLRVDRKMQIKGKTQKGYHSLITVTASRQLFFLYVCYILTYYTCNGASPGIKKQMTMQT